jgi:hypothetical protein
MTRVACKKMHLVYADAVACGCLPPPRTEFEFLLCGIRPITADDPSPVTLQTQIQGGAVVAHRYLPRAPRGTQPEVARAYHAYVDENIPWVDGPPQFAKEHAA